MNEKSYLNEAMLVFAVQSCFWKILNFFYLGASLTDHVRSKVCENGKHVWFDNNQRWQLCTLIVKRERKKEKHKQ